MVDMEFVRTERKPQEICGSFQKVTLKQFAEDFHASGLWNEFYWKPEFKEMSEMQFIQEVYEKIQIPKRSTTGAAGYDFFAPFEIRVNKDWTGRIPTGVRWVTIDRDKVLLCAPRSGLSEKYGTRLKNTVGVVDPDYCTAENEGHIFFNLTAEKPFSIEQGERFCQGMILPFFITEDDKEQPKAKRTGGHGSTGK